MIEKLPKGLHEMWYCRHFSPCSYSTRITRDVFSAKDGQHRPSFRVKLCTMRF